MSLAGSHWVLGAVGAGVGTVPQEHTPMVTRLGLTPRWKRRGCLQCDHGGEQALLQGQGLVCQEDTPMVAPCHCALLDLWGPLCCGGRS